MDASAKPFVQAQTCKAKVLAKPGGQERVCMRVQCGAPEKGNAGARVQERVYMRRKCTFRYEGRDGRWKKSRHFCPIRYC